MANSNRNRKFRNVCFTDYVVTQEHQAELLTKETFSYIVFQRERCPTTGREHLQGYAELFKQTRFAAVKALFGDGVHLEKRRGSAKQADSYCRKAESRVEGTEPSSSGEMSSQGTRTDLEEVRCMIEAGADDMEIAEAHFGNYLRYSSGFQKYRNAFLMRGRMTSGAVYQPKEVIVYWGKAGAGKTRKVWEECKGQEIFVKPAGKWFDGYMNQKVALIDDFTGDVELGLFLKALDGYPTRVEVKNCHSFWNPEKIYITSNLSPEEWYPEANQDQHEAIRRRITKLVHFGGAPAAFAAVPTFTRAEVDQEVHDLFGSDCSTVECQ